MALKGDTISDLPRVSSTGELAGGLHEVEVPSGPGGAYVNKGATTEQLQQVFGNALTPEAILAQIDIAVSAANGVQVGIVNRKLVFSLTTPGGNITPGGPSMGTPTLYASGPSTAY